MMYAKVINGSLNMRRDTNTESERIVLIPNGSRIAIIEKGAVWAKAVYNEYTGYVMIKYLHFEEESSSEDDVEMVTITVPRDVALSLYEALKTSLKQ